MQNLSASAEKSGEKPVVGLERELENPFTRALRFQREVHPTSPSRASPRRQTQSRAGTTFPRQVRRRRIFRRQPVNHVLLLQQPDPLSSFTQFCSSARVWPGLATPSTAARCNHFGNVIGWTPKSFAIRLIVTPNSRFLATRTTSYSPEANRRLPRHSMP